MAMNSSSILNRALETINRSILKAEGFDSLPELDLYRPLPVASIKPTESDAAVAGTDQLAVDESDDQKPEPGLSASVRHGSEKVSTAAAVRAQTTSSSDERISADEWFQDVAWSGEGSSAEESPEDSADEISALPEKTGDENTEDFFSGVSWDSGSGPDSSPAEIGQRAAADSDQAAGFFEETDWDRKGERMPGVDHEEVPASADEGSDHKEHAESFLTDVDWDGVGTGAKVSVDPSGHTPAHVKKLADEERNSAELPANEDAISRSNKAVDAKDKEGEK